MRKISVLLIGMFLLIGCSNEPKKTDEELRLNRIEEEKASYANKTQLIHDSKFGVLDTLLKLSDREFDSIEGADVLSARLYLFRGHEEDQENIFLYRLEKLKTNEDEIQHFIDSLKLKDTLLNEMESTLIKMNRLDTTLYPYEK